jgi:hypothetical protein
MLTYVAVALGLAALFLAWRTGRKNKDLDERIAQVNSRLYQLRRDMQEAQEQAEDDRLKLKFELLKLRGELRVTGEMTIGEIMVIHPQAQQLLARFHLGGCASCMVDDHQSLAEAAALNGRELEPILAALNVLVAEGSNGNGQFSPEQLKTPNVQLQF